MHFPKIYEIASRNVTSISNDATLQEAIETIFSSNHRNIIVKSDDHYFLLGIYDILRFQREHKDTAIRLDTLKLHSIPTVFKEKSILDTLEYLRNDIDQIVVVERDGSLYGLVTQSDILSSIDPDTLMDTYRLADLLKIKKRERWIDKEMPMHDVFDMMERYSHDAVIVIEKRRPVGIITSKDVLRLLKSGVDLTLPVEKYMTAPVEVISRQATLNEALQFMQNKHFKRIVTVDDEGCLVGSITQRELVAMAYTRWVRMLQDYQEELHRINEKLEEKSRRLEYHASTDHLTGLYNRMKFLELFVSEYTVMTQRHNALSLLVIDVDHFKDVNDTKGHNTGDKLLKQISNLLLQELRSVDILCRWGGDEFVALLPAATLREAEKIAEKIRKRIEAFMIEGLPTVTISVGVTQICEGDDLHTVIERADKALYMAKATGRNSVKSYT